jgi:hypothetical protein
MLCPHATREVAIDPPVQASQCRRNGSNDGEPSQTVDDDGSGLPERSDDRAIAPDSKTAHHPANP